MYSMINKVPSSHTKDRKRTAKQIAEWKKATEQAASDACHYTVFCKRPHCVALGSGVGCRCGEQKGQGEVGGTFLS